jgi:hypothetical protein
MDGVVFYAAGVSDSTCTNTAEFIRERERLTEALKTDGLFVYFGTCSTDDTAYVRHKWEMEGLVRGRGNYLICRLPVVAGKSPNPHTLLNFLHARISRSEPFTLWTRARRNVIDVVDVGEIVRWVINDGVVNETIDVCAPFDYSIDQIVGAFEQLTGKKALAARVEHGSATITNRLRIAEVPIDFSGDYLGAVIRRYYA